MSTPHHPYAARPIARSISSSGARAPAGALGFAWLCLLALAATWLIVSLVPAVHLRDAVALRDFTLLGRPHVDDLANGLLDLFSLVPMIIWATLLVSIALIRRRPRVAVAVGLVMALAPLSADLLKPLLAHPHASVEGISVVSASWPSGHATAALTLALCATLVAPARLRLHVLALGLAFSLAVGVSLLILAWHMPSDVLGGYLLASLWMALLIATLRACERRWPSSRAPALRSG
jgi:membrane-associated phospholipid phosphatase